VDLRVSLPALDLGPLGAQLLPAGAAVRALHLDERALRLEAHAPLAGTIALLADARFHGPTLTLSNFRIEGGMLARAFLLGEVQRRIGALDWRKGPLHAYGEPDGDRLHLRWDMRPE
jgi:hypothetical protein